MKKIRFPHKLGWQFLLMILITIVLPSMLFYGKIVKRYSDELFRQAIEERVSVLQEINRITAFQLKDYQELSMTVYYNNTTKAFLDSKQYRKTTNSVDSVLRTLRNAIPYIDSVVLCFGKDVHCYGRNYGNLEEYREKYEQQVMDAEGRCVWLPTECMVSGEGARAPKVFALARALNAQDGPVGTMYMFCSSDFFKNIMSNPILSEGESHYYILDPGGQIISSDQYQTVGTTAALGFSPAECTGKEGSLNFRDANGVEQTATYSKVEGLGWISVVVCSKQYLYRSLYELKAMTLNFSLIYLLAMALGYGMIYVVLLRPLSRLSSGMSHVSKGEFLELPSAPVKNEVQQLTVSYNDMVVHIQRLLEKIREEEKAKNKQRIKVLYMQIGPHFLYNTLNSVKWMAALNNQTGIKTMVDALMKLLGGVTYNKEDNVTVRQELELLSSYVYIQKVRFVNFDIQYQVPEEVMELQIGRFMLQPFVENSIIHGLRGLSYEGIIVISAYVDDALHFEIRDNGRGFDPAAPQPSDPVKSDHDHVGIENVKERIRLNYGDSYGVTVESVPGEGTKVCLKLPILH